MKYLAFREQFKSLAFFSLKTVRLAVPGFQRIQLTRWQDKGYIRPIIRGHYMFADAQITEELLMLLANKLVMPSYVSTDFVFARHNLIPEGVFQITSITSKKTQQHDTQFATFTYRHLKPTLIFGYCLSETPMGQINIATLEKAILDFLYLTPQADNISFFEEMRMNKEILLDLDRKKLDSYLNVFNQTLLRQRVARLLEYAFN